MPLSYRNLNSTGQKHAKELKHMITRLFFYEQCEPLLGDSQNNVYKQVLFLLFIRSVAQTNLNTGSLSFANFAQCKNGLSKHSRPKQQVSRSCSGGYSCNNSSLRGGRKSVLNL